MRLALCGILLLAAAAAAAVDPTTMVQIPAGEFSMGRAGSTEMPAHRVRLSSFWLDVHEVTNAQYLAFCQATDRDLPVYWNLERFHCGEAWPDRPVIGVSHGDAAAYAEWVGKRLPTEAEWEYAARAGGTARFGTDEVMDKSQANYKTSKIDSPSPVMSYAANPWGLYDMIGNVREWVSDRHGAEVPAASLVPEDGDLAGIEPVVDPTGPVTGPGLVKGGGWFSGPSCQPPHVRNAYPRNWGDFAVGFRCARDVE